MAFSEKYCLSTGSNLNAGDDAGSPSMSDTAGTGGWVSATNVYTSVATNGTVAVGQFISIYTGSPTSTGYVARITNVSGGSGSAWVITTSTTAFSGTVPTTGGTFKAQVGGAWLGPTGAVGFPFNFITSVLTNAAGDTYRVNLAGTFNITATLTYTGNGDRGVFQGMTSVPGDLGRATIDGGMSGTSYVLLTISNGTLITTRDLILQNNGASGALNGFSPQGFIERVTVNNVRGDGFLLNSQALLVECEAYGCNQNNNVQHGGFRLANSSLLLIRCTSHHNTGSNNCGFACLSGGVFLINCIADSNGLHGFYGATTGQVVLEGFTAYNQTVGAGIYSDAGFLRILMENCILANNATYGVNNSGSTTAFRLINCGFYLNSSGQTSGTVDATGTITYASQPLNAPTQGDYTPILSTAKNAGRGKFTQNSASWTNFTGTTSYPDVGAVQHLDAPLAPTKTETLLTWDV